MKMYHYCHLRWDEFLTHYHKRLNAEPTLFMIKAKFRERIRSKADTAQINEMLLMVLCHCICVVIQSMYELNIELTLGAES